MRQSPLPGRVAKWLQTFAFDVASLVNKGWFAMNNSNRLATIATRQRKSLLRDLAFAALVVLASAISISSVSTAAHAAHHELVSR